MIYGAPVSTLHLTEPKYTKQDLVNIISGNIEAWIGLSAVHTYLFFERIYLTLLEAELITTPDWCLRLSAWLHLQHHRYLGYLRQLLNLIKNFGSIILTHLSGLIDYLKLSCNLFTLLRRPKSSVKKRES